MRERFEELNIQAQGAFAAGEADRSLELFAEAERLAAEQGEQDLADRAFCNRCAVLIELDRAAEHLPRLKRILLASRDTKNRWLAAYHTAIACDLADDAERAASYAERAMALAEELGEPYCSARSANLAGILAVRASRFDQAERAYRLAISFHRNQDGHQRNMEAVEKDNLGYVLICCGRFEEGLRLCEGARATLESARADHYLHEVLQDLCYGYLLDDQLERAEACGERALELALANDDRLVVKNCLFLLGEVAVRRGDTFRARRRLRELAGYYPEVALSEEIIDVFLATDLTSVVNLRG
jgi:tetratricopeptide (TPR) repeat protein